MKILIVTDAWEPQVNGVVRTLKSTRRELAMGHTVELLTPLEFRTVPCPTYPEIRLSLLPGRAVAERIRAFAPDALHIATEGPLGMAARRHALRSKVPFTTAYHTRFPEYVQARFGIPLARTYRFLSWFTGRPGCDGADPGSARRPAPLRHRPRRAVVARSGLDVFTAQRANVLNTAHPIFLYVGRVAVEKNVEAFLALDLPGSKWVVGDGRPRLAARALSGCQLSGRAEPARAGQGVCFGRCLRLSEPHGYLRPCCWKRWPAACRWQPTRSPAPSTCWARAGPA